MIEFKKGSFMPSKNYTLKILELAHDSLSGAHIGINQTRAKISNIFYCEICQKKQKKTQKVHLTPIPTMAQAFDRVNMGLIGPLPMAQRKNRYILTVIDSATKYPKAVLMRGKKEKTIAENLIKIFSRTGFLKEILSDQHPNFVGKIMKEFFHQLNIVKISSTPYHPQTNGLI